MSSKRQSLPGPQSSAENQGIQDAEPAASTAVQEAEHFRTEHLREDLAKRAISGGFVTFASQAVKFVLNFGGAVVLARLLPPEDFGLVAMVSAVTGYLSIFKEAGLSTATIQRETITQEQVSGLFWINVALSSAIGVGCMILAPFVALFYRDPRLTDIMLALSLTFLLTGPTVQHQALLHRQMQFKALALIDVGSLFVGIVVGCSLAWFGFDYWSLVAMQLVTAGLGLLLTWWISAWRPSFPKWRSGVAPLLTFGVHLTASNLIVRFAANLDSVLIGRFFGAQPLGLYSRASALLVRPLEQFLGPISAVFIPVLSRLQSEPDRYRRNFNLVYDLIALVTFPFGALCLALSEPMVLLVLGQRWAEAIPLFAGFSLIALYSPLTIATSWLFMSQGRGKDLLRGYMMTSVVIVVAYVAALPWGPLGLILAFAASGFLLRLPIVYYLAGRQGPVTTKDLWSGLLYHTLCWAAVCGAAGLTRAAVIDSAPVVQLLVCAPVGLAAGAGVIFGLQRTRRTASYALQAGIGWLRDRKEGSGGGLS